VTRGRFRLVDALLSRFGENDADNFLDRARRHRFPFCRRHPVAIPVKKNFNVFMYPIPSRAAVA
jgi:hypothetical protein